jgi:hypothetical protein
VLTTNPAVHQAAAHSQPITHPCSSTTLQVLPAVYLFVGRSLNATPVQLGTLTLCRAMVQVGHACSAAPTTRAQTTHHLQHLQLAHACLTDRTNHPPTRPPAPQRMRCMSPLVRWTLLTDIPLPAPSPSCNSPIILHHPDAVVAAEWHPG